MKLTKALINRLKDKDKKVILTDNYLHNQEFAVKRSLLDLPDGVIQDVQVCSDKSQDDKIDSYTNESDFIESKVFELKDYNYIVKRDFTYIKPRDIKYISNGYGFYEYEDRVKYEVHFCLFVEYLNILKQLDKEVKGIKLEYVYKDRVIEGKKNPFAYLRILKDSEVLGFVALVILKTDLKNKNTYYTLENKETKEQIIVGSHFE